MVHSRSRTHELAVLLIAMGFVSATASGANFTCTASAPMPGLVRGEGSTELVGDMHRANPSIAQWRRSLFCQQAKKVCPIRRRL